MAQAQKGKRPTISTIRLDEATRARIVKELGLGGGLSAIPEEIAFVAVPREEAGYEEAEVTGYTQDASSNVFANRRLTPKLKLEDLPAKVEEAAKVKGGALSTSRLTMVIPE